MWNEEQIAGGAAISNEDGRAAFYAPPVIRQNGQSGTFTRTTRTKEGSTKEEVKSLEVVFLKHRSQISSAYSPSKVKKASYFTSEFDNPNELVDILKLDGGKIEVHESGVTTKAAFDKIFSLTKLTPKNEKVIYVLIDGEVNKLSLKGGSMGPYFDYLKALKEEGVAHSFMVVTSVTDSGMTKNDAGMSYHHMVFKNVGESDPAVVIAKQKEVDAALKTANKPRVAEGADDSEAAWAALSEEATVTVD